MEGGRKVSVEDILVFGGSGSPRLTQKICDYLEIEQGNSQMIRFSEGNLFVRIGANVRGRRVYLVQSTAFPFIFDTSHKYIYTYRYRPAPVFSSAIILASHGCLQVLVYPQSCPVGGLAP